MVFAATVPTNCPGASPNSGLRSLVIRPPRTSTYAAIADEFIKHGRVLSDALCATDVQLTGLPPSIMVLPGVSVRHATRWSSIQPLANGPGPLSCSSQSHQPRLAYAGRTFRR